MEGPPNGAQHGEPIMAHRSHSRKPETRKAGKAKASTIYASPVSQLENVASVAVAKSIPAKKITIPVPGKLAVYLLPCMDDIALLESNESGFEARRWGEIRSHLQAAFDGLWKIAGEYMEMDDFGSVLED